MITPQNRIIIVDNEKEELDNLTKAFLDTGIGCRPFEYTEDYNEEPLNSVELTLLRREPNSPSIYKKSYLSPLLINT